MEFCNSHECLENVISRQGGFFCGRKESNLLLGAAPEELALAIGYRANQLRDWLKHYPPVARPQGGHPVIGQGMSAPIALSLQAAVRDAARYEVVADDLGSLLRKLAIQARITLVVRVPLYLES
jgi:hypothetical protein